MLRPTRFRRAAARALGIRTHSSLPRISAVQIGVVTALAPPPPGFNGALQLQHPSPAAMAMVIRWR